MNFRHILRTCIVMALFSNVATQLSAETHSKKTFLTPQAVGTNMPMELTTWHELAYQKLEKRDGHNIFSHLVMTPFYQGSNNQDDLGEYFGIGSRKNSFTVGTLADFDAGKVDILGEYLIHDVDGVAVGGEVTFHPKQETWGIRFDYFQSFNHPFGGLFFKASMPVVYVKSSVGMDISDSAPLALAGEDFSLRDFFTGKVKVTADINPDNLQSPLEKAKIASEEEGKFGVADINLALGYKLHETTATHIYLSAQIIVPTGQHPTGEFLFHPVVGNGKHFGLGARLDCAAELWSNNRAAVRALLNVDYRYLFEAGEHRTLGLKGFSIGDQNRPSNMAHYFLAGEIDKQNQSLFPAANLLTQSLRVKPGNQFDIFFDLSFKSSRFVIDLGYNFFYKDEEDCWMKEHWTDGKYALVKADYATSTQLTTARVLYNLDKTNFDVDAAKTPSQLTNKIFAGLGYEFRYSKSVPGQVGIGGSYEFASNNAALENYAVWLKAGVSF